MKNQKSTLLFNKKRNKEGNKLIFSLLFYFFLILNAKSQAPYCEAMGTPCTLDPVEASKFKPDEYSPILTINLNFHFYQNGDVFNPMNFAETWDGINVGNMADGIPDGIYNPVVVTGSTYADAIVWRINNRLEFNPQMNLPIGNSTPNIPYQFRFRKNSVQYHTWEPTEGVPSGYSYPPNGDGIDIFFFDNDAQVMLGPKTFELECGTVTVPDFPLWWDLNDNGIQDSGTEMTHAQHGSSYYNSSYVNIFESWITFKYTSDNWCSYQNAYENLVWNISRQILHEVGHAFCLPHTVLYGSGGICNDCNDYCDDTPTGIEMTVANGVHPGNCVSACAENPPVCSNNLMDYCEAATALTPQQLGRWYYNLYSNHLYSVYNDYCEHDGSNTQLTSGTNVTWEGIRICKGDITVEAGAILTLKGRLWMPEHGKIIVKPGGRLYINGGCIGTLCGGLWEGIEVWGNSTLPQTLGNQGLVNLTNNALIEEARTAIRTIKNTGTSHYSNLDWSKTGGIIQATNANFKNNIKGIEFLTFQNKNPQNLPINNVSYFRNCLFETNDVSHFDGTTITHGITMWGVNGIPIYGCSFNYIVPTDNIENRGNGIFAGMSTFRILDYGNDRNEFLNLNRAIKATGPAKGFYPIIDHAKFINNRGGVLLAGFGLSQITRNNFNWVAITEPSNTPTYGLYLQGCQGYRVEENYFDAADGIETFGVCVNNSGNSITQIYRNYFTNLHAASMVYNDNRKELAIGEPGLQWICNEYGTSGSNSNSNTYQIGLWGSEVAGIPSSQSLFQGTNPSISAGNKFYEDCTPNPNDPNEYPNERELKLMEQIDGSYYNYVHDNPALSTPLCRTPGIGLIYSGGNNTNFCPSNFSVVHNTITIATSIQEAHTFEQQLKTAYDGYANNGTGPALKSILMDAAKTSIEVRNALMDAAPKVTDELLLLALKRQPELEGWHMAQAMLANSPLRASVMNELAKSDYYPFYKALVQAGQSGGLTTRQLMEMDYANFISSQQYDFDQLLQIQMNFEESEIGNWENLETQLTALDFMLTPSDKAQLALSKGDLNEAATQLTNCGTEENDYCECISVALELAQNGMTSTGLPNNVVSDLQNMASTSGHKMQATAELLLEFWGLGVYKELLELPEGATLRSTRIPKLEEIEIKSLGVNPNPADGIVYINYLLPDGWVKAEITVYDYLGKVSSKFDASQFDGIIEFDGQLLPAGVYLVELEVDNIKISSTKLTLVH